MGLCRAAAASASALLIGLGSTGTATAGPGEYCQLQPRPPACDLGAAQQPKPQPTAKPPSLSGSVPWSNAGPGAVAPASPPRNGQQGGQPAGSQRQPGQQ